MAQQSVVVDISLLGKMAGYIEMLVKDPHSTVFAPLSDIYRAFGLHEEAVAVAQKGSEMVPTYVPGFVALGRALAEIGDLAGATGAYRKALFLDPVNLAALTGLASCCLGCGQSEEALALLMRAQLIDSHDEVVKQLLLVVNKLSTISAPVPRLQDSFVSTPLPPLVEVTDAVKDKPAGIATGIAPLPSIATATLAEIYIKQGFPERALKVYSDLLVDDPENAEVRQRYDALLLQFNSPVITKVPEAVTVSSNEVEPVSRTVTFPDVKGKDALFLLYGRWLDAVHRRQADVR